MTSVYIDGVILGRVNVQLICHLNWSSL